ncbi:MAG: hypothetical protein PHW10_01930 [Candidatus Peribacteraceae bacterium]|nr:hypothetical protein [Candidatus Peribacteraceae bacterium]
MQIQNHFRFGFGLLLLSFAVGMAGTMGIRPLFFHAQVPECSTTEDCNDGNPCTDDSCNDSVCEHSNNTNSCDDDDGCTVNDTCSLGMCQGSTRDCDDGNVCTDDVCLYDECTHTDISCDDEDACTTDSCDSISGCQNIDSVTCDNLNCEACDAETGECASTCDGTYCDGAGICVECTEDSHCGYYKCVDSACTSSCDTNEDCSGGGLCTGEGGSCVQCLTETDCGAYDCVENACLTTCTTADDCSTGNGCDTIGHACETACSSDTDCAATEYCGLQGACETGCRNGQDDVECGAYACESHACLDICSNDEDCRTDYWCGQDQECHNTCAADTDCASGSVCDAGACFVGNCTDDSDCGGGFACVDHACITICLDDADCKTGYWCGSNGTCRDVCTDDDDCLEGKVCDAGACYTGDCTSDSQCEAGAYACESHVCNTTCAANDDCGSGYVCDAGDCTTCTLSVQCSAGRWCNPETQLCQIGCDDDAPCVPFACDLDSHTCPVSCTENSGCTTGYWCGQDQECHNTCGDDSDCGAAWVCDANQCFAGNCTDESECGAYACMEHTCATACSIPGNQCAAGFICVTATQTCEEYWSVMDATYDRDLPPGQSKGGSRGGQHGAPSHYKIGGSIDAAYGPEQGTKPVALGLLPGFVPPSGKTSADGLHGTAPETPPPAPAGPSLPWYVQPLAILLGQNALPMGYRPHDTVTRAQMTTIISRSAAAQGMLLPDVTDYIPGNGPAARAEAAYVILRTFGIPILDTGPSYHDPLLRATATAFGLGILQGDADGFLAPDRAVTQAELAVMIVRAMDAAWQMQTAR